MDPRRTQNSETIKLLEENTGKICDIGFGADFLATTPTQATKEEKRYIGLDENLKLLRIKGYDRQSGTAARGAGGTAETKLTSGLHQGLRLPDTHRPA